jgi:hypothetical protein
MKISYTESGKHALEDALQRYQTFLEQEVRRKKAVLGDEELEITAEDLKPFFISKPKKKRFLTLEVRRNILNFISRTYTFVGIGIFVGSFVYKDAVQYYENNSEQASYALAGLVMTALGAAMTWYGNRVFESKLQEIKKREEILSILESIADEPHNSSNVSEFKVTYDSFLNSSDIEKYRERNVVIEKNKDW